MKRLALLCILTVALPSCGGAGRSLPATASYAPSAQNAAAATTANKRHRKKVKVKVRVRVPGRKRGMRRALYRRLNVAASTAGMLVNVYAHGTQTLIASTASDVSGGSPNCSPAGTGRNCTFEIAVPPGNDDFVFKTYDRAPVAGSIPAGANQLGAGVANQTIAEGSTNAAVATTLGGVVASIAMNASPPAWHTLLVQNATLQVLAADAGGNAIVGNYVDANGNPITIALSPAYSGGCCASVNFSTTTLSAPSATGVALTQAPNGNTFSSGPIVVTITATPSGGPSSNATATIGLDYPTFSHFADNNLNAVGPFFGGIGLQSGTDVVYSFNSGNGGIGDFNIAGQSISDIVSGTQVGGGISLPAGVPLIAGPTNLYDVNAGALVLAPGCSSTPCAGGTGSGMAVDAGGDTWYGNGTNVIEYNGAATTTFSIPGSASAGMAADGLGNIWIANGSGPSVLVFNTTTHVTTTVNMPQPNAHPFDVYTDASDKVWVTDRSSTQMVEFDPTTLPAPTHTTYNTPNSSDEPWYIVQDPIQQTTYWYTYQDGTNAGVGRLDTVTNSVTQANDPICCFSILQPGPILDNNGLLYFVLDGSSSFEVVQP